MGSLFTENAMGFAKHPVVEKIGSDFLNNRPTLCLSPVVAKEATGSG